MKLGENALAECLDTIIVWEAEIVAKLQTNRAMNLLSAHQQEEYDNATRCYICRREFEEGEARGPKDRDHDHITSWFIGAAHRQCNLERPVCFEIPVIFHNFHGYDAHIIVHEFGKRPDREIKVIVQNISSSSGGQTWYFATRFSSCLLHWSGLRPRWPRSVATTFKISTTWSRKCTLMRTLSSSSGREYFSTTTSTP